MDKQLWLPFPMPDIPRSSSKRPDPPRSTPEIESGSLRRRQKPNHLGLSPNIGDCVDLVDFHIKCDNFLHSDETKEFFMSQKKCRFCS